MPRQPRSRQGAYDTAQTCVNGHVISDMTLCHPELCQKFCSKCGAATLTACPSCDTSIRGHFSLAGLVRLVNLLEPDYPVPHFCHECGQAYPWTAAGLKAVQDLADEVEAFSQQDREALRESLNDIVRDTPQTSLASKRFARLLNKAGPTAATAIKDILVNLVTETAKRQIWP